MKKINALIFTGFFIFIAATLNSTTVFAAPKIWTGNNSSAWSDPLNWGGSAPGSGDSLTFTGTNTTNSNDFTGYSFSGITLSSATNSFNLGGNPITLTGDIVDTAPSAQGVNLNITLGSPVTFRTTVGTLFINTGYTVDNNGKLLTVDAGYWVIFDSNLIGSGGLTKTGSSTLALRGTNTYSGATRVSAGLLELDNGFAIGDNSAVTLDNTAGVSLKLNNANEAIGSLAGGGTTGGNVDLQTFTLSTGGDNTSTAYAGVMSGTGGLTKTGNGTLTLTGINTYTGLTTVTAGELDLNTVGTSIAGNLTVSGGTAKLLAASQIAATKNLVVSGGTFNIQGFNQTLAGVQMTSGSISGSGGILTNNTTAYDMQSGAVSAILAGTAALNKTTAGTVTLSGANTYSGATTLTDGTLSVGAAGNLGAAASNLVFDGGTLQITGTALTSISGIGHTVITNADKTVGLDIDNAANTFTFDRVLNQATGGLVKSGAGTLVLNQANTYTGGTTLNAGKLTLGNNEALGTGRFTINGGTLDVTGVTYLNNNNPQTWGGDFTFAGSNILNLGNGAVTMAADRKITVDGSWMVVAGKISGAGKLTKDGAGMLYLTGANDYSGGTTLNAGALRLGNNTALGTGIFTINGGTLDSNGITLTNNNLQTWGGDFGFTGTNDLNLGTGAVTLTATPTVTVDANTLTEGGAIGGAFGLTKDGAGTLILTGNNGYTGVTGIANGVLNIQNAGALGTVGNGTNVGIGGALQIQGGITTLAEPLHIAGTGILLDGALRNIQDNNEYTGAITLDVNSRINSDAGTLTLSGGITGGGNALTVGGAGNTTINSVIGGAASALTKDGAGILMLSGANTYTGLTTIGGGTLQVSNANAVGTGALTNNATLSVGTTALSVPGIYTQNAGSALTLTANSTSNFGNIISPANAVVDAGSTVAVNVGGYMPNNATLKVIAGGGGAGVAVPTTITSSNPKYTFTGLSSNGNLILTVNRSANGFEPDGRDPNGKKVGKVLDDVVDPTPDMRGILDTMDAMSNTNVGQALSTLSPVVDSGVTNVSNTAIVQFVGASEDRLVNLYAQAHNEETGVSTGSKEKSGFEAWGRGFGQAAHQDARGNSNGYSATIWGTALGGDIPAFHEKVRFGASGGYASSNVNSKDNSGKTYINSYQSTLYGGYIDPAKPYYINGAFAFAYNTYKSKRDIVIGNTIQRRANSSYRGQQYSVLLDGGYTFKTKNVNITPIASLQYLHLHLQSYTETGADALNLTVKSQDYDMLQSALGAKLDHPFELSYGTLTPEVHARWLYDFINDNQDTTSTFAGGGGSFATQGFTPARNALNVGGRLALATKGNWSVDANYDFEYKQDYTSHTGWADIRYKF